MLGLDLRFNVPKCRLAGTLLILRGLICGLICSQILTAAAQVPGVNEREIKIGSCSALDGPARQLGLQTLLGATVYFQYVNDHGGVNGRKLRLVSFDDGYDPEKATGCFASLKREKVFAAGF